MNCELLGCRLGSDPRSSEKISTELYLEKFQICIAFRVQNPAKYAHQYVYIYIYIHTYCRSVYIYIYIYMYIYNIYISTNPITNPSTLQPGSGSGRTSLGPWWQNWKRRVVEIRRFHPLPIRWDIRGQLGFTNLEDHPS